MPPGALTGRDPTLVDTVGTDHAASICSLADLLRYDYEQSEYGNVILPLTALRRMDCLLEPTKASVLDRARRLEGTDERESKLANEAGLRFFNTSPLDLRRVLDSPEQIDGNIRAYIAGFSAGARDVIDELDFDVQITRLDKAGLLHLLVSKFADLDLHEEALSYSEFRLLYESLELHFSELARCPASAPASEGVEAGPAPGSATDLAGETTRGISVYALPYFMNVPVDPISMHLNPILAHSLLTGGRSDRDVIQRFQDQVRTSPEPEAPVLARIYRTRGKGAARQERQFYALVEAADHWRGADRTGKREWFLSSLRLLDAAANTTGLQVHRILDQHDPPSFPLPYLVCRPGAAYRSEVGPPLDPQDRPPRHSGRIDGPVPDVPSLSLAVGRECAERPRRPSVLWRRKATEPS